MNHKTVHLPFTIPQDEAGFGPFFRRYYKEVVLSAFRILREQNRAEDVAQEVFAEIWKKRLGLEVENILAYLRKAAVNKALNELRSQGKMPLADESEIELRTESVHLPDNQNLDDLHKALQNAIHRLPERCRLVLILSRYEQLSQAEIAQEMNISVKTVENQIGKALKMLRTMLENYHVWGWWWIGVQFFTKFSFAGIGDFLQNIVYSI